MNPYTLDPIVELLKRMPADKRRDAIKEMPLPIQMNLQYNFRLFGHEYQRYLWDKEYRTAVISSGRSAGKSYSLMELMKYRVYQGIKHDSAIVCASHTKFKTDIWENPKGLQSVFCREDKPKFNHSSSTVLFHTGARMLVFSGDAPEKMRGANLCHVYIDELSTFQYPDEVYNQAQLTSRKGINPSITIASTPMPIPLFQRLNREAKQSDSGVIWQAVSTYENRENIAPEFLQAIERLYGGTKYGRQEIYGELIEDGGIMFSQDIFNKSRASQVPQLEAIAIGLDPAGTNNKYSDMTGIVVSGRSTNGHIYVLADYSNKYSPLEWSKIVSNLYTEYSKICRNVIIVAESNYGGSMVESNLRMYNPNLPIFNSHSSTSKHKRAEIPSALFERGVCHMVGNKMVDLEAQCCEFMPYATNQRDDRTDAMVFTILYLATGQANAVRSFTNLRQF